jgi:hypothetical protein
VIQIGAPLRQRCLNRSHFIGSFAVLLGCPRHAIDSLPSEHSHDRHHHQRNHHFDQGKAS